MVLTETPDYSDRILKYNCNFSGQGYAQFSPAPAQKGPLDCLFKERSIYSNRAVRI